jgi:mono/diheme cytochrome c family protein
MAALSAAGYWLTRPPAVDAVQSGVSPERGRKLFWSRARCSLCHQVGSRGGLRRGPPLSESESLPAVGARAAARALERSRASGRPYTAADYLVESLLEPGAFIVPGYRNEMPPARLGPPPLTDDEIRSLLAYLQSLGGTVDLNAIRLPARPAPSAPHGAAPAGDGLSPPSESGTRNPR